MNNRRDYFYFGLNGRHKGFYNDSDFEKSLSEINYTDFFEEHRDEDFPHDSAYTLLCGSCNIFSLALQKKLNYNQYIIQGNNKRGFHSFCQVYRNGCWYYIDARGITTSFDEFMQIAKRFVNDEYTIRPIENKDIERWEEDKYTKETLAFAEAVINKFMQCYTV